MRSYAKSYNAVIPVRKIVPVQRRMRETLPPKTRRVARQGDAWILRIGLQTTLEIKRNGLFVDGALVGGKTRKFTIVTFAEWAIERAPFLDYSPERLIRFIPRAFSRLSSRKVKPSVARTALMRLACPKTVVKPKKLPFVPIHPWSTFEEWELNSSAAKRIRASLKKALNKRNKKTGKKPGAKAQATIRRKAQERLVVRWNEYRSLHFPQSAPCPDSWENAMLARFGFTINLDSMAFAPSEEFPCFNGNYPQDFPYMLSACTALNLTQSVKRVHTALSAQLATNKAPFVFTTQNVKPKTSYVHVPRVLQFTRESIRVG